MILSKSVFLAVNARLRWLKNVVGVYLFQVSLLLIGQQDLVDFFRYRHCFPLAGGLCKFYANAGGRQPIQRQILLHFLQFKIIGAPKNFYKWPRPLFRPKANHTCHQKPNPFHETVPLMSGITWTTLMTTTTACWITRTTTMTAMEFWTER
jgi:hypothetical protein